MVNVSGRVSDLLGRVWWMPVVRGVLLIILGLLMMVDPLATLGALVWVFGIFAIADGVTVLIEAFLVRGRPGLGWWVAEAVVSIAFGVLILLWPGLSILTLFYLLALWILIVGVMALVVAASQFRARDLGWVGTLLFGLISFLFGLLAVVRPGDTIEVVVLVYGLFALVSGAVMIVAGFVTRSFGRQLAAVSAGASGPGTGSAGPVG